MKKIITIIYLFLLSGCATVMRDSNQIVPIQANIDDVYIEILDANGAIVYSGKTPTTVWLKTSRKGYFSPAKYTVKAYKEGYVTQYTTIDWHISNWYWFGNIVFGYVVGWFFVDPLTGKMYYLDDIATINMPLKQD